MRISFKTYDFLPEEAKKIRKEVFVDEQKFVDEFDDLDDKAIHIVMFCDDVAIGTSRIIYSEAHKCYCVGRFAIVKSFRNNHLGSQLMKETEKEIIKRFGHIEIGISSQEKAENFYKKCGYTSTEYRYLDQYCPHVWMIKKL